jgi:Regulator of chromosome condensation (RCC1) repeat
MSATSSQQTKSQLKSARRFQAPGGLYLLMTGLALGPLAACSAAANDGEDEVALAQPVDRLDLDLPGKSFPIIDFPITDFPKKPRIPRPPAPDPNELLEITAGGYTTCVRKRSGDVYCWGLDDALQVGITATTTCTGQACVDRPSLVTGVGFTTATQVESGHDHTCALDPAGHAYCWGRGNLGELGGGSPGLGFTISASTPAPVAGGLIFTSISAGTQSACGTTYGDAYCWGAIMGNSSVPTSVYSPTGLAPVGITVGAQHVCAQWVAFGIRETNCWEGNSYGQSGSASAPRVGIGLGPNVGTAALRVTAQDNFTCVDQPTPSVQCFGENGYGQLGNGTSGYYTSTHVPQTVGASSVPPLALHGVTTGNVHACALDAAGAAYCWGNGYWGQVGNGVSAISSTPAAVTGGLTFRAIAAGHQHTCAIGTNNHIYCWGSNYQGQLGTQYVNPTTGSRGWVSNPVQALDP